MQMRTYMWIVDLAIESEIRNQCHQNDLYSIQEVQPGQHWVRGELHLLPVWHLGGGGARGRGQCLGRGPQWRHPGPLLGGGARGPAQEAGLRLGLLQRPDTAGHWAGGVAPRGGQAAQLRLCEWRQPRPRPRPGTGGGHQPPQPSLGCTKVRRGPPSVSTAPRRAPPVAAPSLGPPRSSAPPPRPAPAWPVVGCARLCWGLVLLISCPRTHAAPAAPD